MFYLQVANLGKAFRAPSGAAREILCEASFSAARGETIALTGVSGAGKSTLLHLLAGLEGADRGQICAGEFAVTDAGAKALADWRSREVGLVFQAHHLLPDLSASENVALPLLIQRAPPRVAQRLAVEALTEVGLPTQPEQRVGQLSGGEQQRVALARALVTKPSFLLADEPTGQLDTATGAEIVELLLSYAHKHNALLVLATHNEKWSWRCERRLELSSGRLREVN